MDDRRFDVLVKRLARVRLPRLTAVRGVAFGALAGLVGAALAEAESEAAPRRGKHRPHRRGTPRGRTRAARDADRRAGVGTERKKRKKKGACPGGTTRCGAGCVDTSGDPGNCGRCGAVCAAGQACQGGTCTCNGERCTGCCDGTTCRAGGSDAQCGAGGVACRACADGQICCDGACRDLSTDARHCGTCGNACGQTGNACVGGSCTCFGRAACPPGWRCCPDGEAGPGCYLLTHSFSSCGACGNACDAEKANRCTEGVCTCNGDVCTGGETCCNGVCRSAFDDPFNCGACNTFCLGLVWATADPWSNANVGCPGGTCTFGCKGQNYDVDGNPRNGCEQEDTQTNHTQETAKDLGSRSCRDTDGGSFSGTIYSDAREHANPEAAGFDPDTGAAPLWFRVFASGGVCSNDPAVSLTMTGGTSGCYKLTLRTNLGTHEKTITNGSASIVLGSGSYSDGTNVFFTVEKTCGTSVREVASFTATYHL
jgi:hypothetical protein